MIAFSYVGRDANGVLVRGIKTADKKPAALRILREDEGIEVISCESALGTSVSLAGLYAAAQQLLAESGIAQARQGFFRLAAAYSKRAERPADAIAAYLPDCPSPRFKAVLRDMLTALTQHGNDLSVAMARHKEFSTQQVEMVRAAELAEQSLAPTFQRIAKMETALRRRRSADLIGRASIYLSYFMSVVVVWFVTYYYLPRLMEIARSYHVEDAVPPAVRFLAFVGQLTLSPLGCIVVLGTIGLCITVWRSLMRQRGFARFIEAQRWRLAALRELQLRDDRALALTMLSGLRASAVDGVLSLRLVAQSMSSVIFGDAIERQAQTVADGGATFQQSFSTERLWGPEVIGLLTKSDQDFVTLSEDMAGDFEKDAEAGAALAGVAKNGGHLLLAAGIALVLTMIVYLSGFAVNHAILQRNV